MKDEFLQVQNRINNAFALLKATSDRTERRKILVELKSAIDEADHVLRAGEYSKEKPTGQS